MKLQVEVCRSLKNVLSEHNTVLSYDFLFRPLSAKDLFYSQFKPILKHCDPKMGIIISISDLNINWDKSDRKTERNCRKIQIKNID